MKFRGHVEVYGAAGEGDEGPYIGSSPEIEFGADSEEAAKEWLRGWWLRSTRTWHDDDPWGDEPASGTAPPGSWIVPVAEQI